MNDITLHRYGFYIKARSPDNSDVLADIGCIFCFYVSENNQQKLAEQGWIPADGRSLSVKEYPELFLLIGHTYGPEKYIPLKLKFWKFTLTLNFIKCLNPEFDEDLFVMPDFRGCTL
jgi:hypothetical protein